MSVNANSISLGVRLYRLVRTLKSSLAKYIRQVILDFLFKDNIITLTLGNTNVYIKGNDIKITDIRFLELDAGKVFIGLEDPSAIEAEKERYLNGTDIDYWKAQGVMINEEFQQTCVLK